MGALTLLVGCATPTVVRPILSTDASLSCEQLEREMGEADRVRNDAAKESGVTPTNAMAVLFFWPALFTTYTNVSSAIAAADQRKAYLATIHRDKKCHLNGKKHTTESSPSKTQKGSSPLVDAKQLLDLDFRKNYMPTQFAALSDTDAVPHISKICKEHYSKFLTKSNPKAFAVSETGICGFSWGIKPPLPELPTDPARRAVLACERFSKLSCKIYALDDAVVWNAQ